MNFTLQETIYIATNVTWTLKLSSQSLVIFSAQRADVSRPLASQNKNISLKCQWPQKSFDSILTIFSGLSLNLSTSDSESSFLLTTSCKTLIGLNSFVVMILSFTEIQHCLFAKNIAAADYFKVFIPVVDCFMLFET